MEQKTKKSKELIVKGTQNIIILGLISCLRIYPVKWSTH